MRVELEPVDRLAGDVRTPGDKSISHRAVMLASLAPGVSTITGCSNGEDVAGTLAVMSDLGAGVERDGERLIVSGPPDGLRPSDRPLDCGNSGTTMRLLCGLLGSVPGRHHLVGDPSLSRRPMDRVAIPLRLMGLDVDGEGEQIHPPLDVHRGPRPLRAIDYAVPVPSAQVKSAVLLAGLTADAETTVREAVRTRANTEEMLLRAGLEIDVHEDGDGRTVRLRPGRPRPVDWIVPGDPSQAAFFVVAAAILSRSDVVVRQVYAGAERLGFVGVLRRMGARVEASGSDGLVDLRTSGSDLEATEVLAKEIPSVDEVPILAVAAAAASGTSRFVDVGELRVKESDRLAGTVELVSALGARAWAEGDDLIVEGLGSSRRFLPFTFRAGLDHRMAMAAAVAAVAGSGGVVEGAETVATSYPRFFDDLASLR